MNVPLFEGNMSTIVTPFDSKGAALHSMPSKGSWTSL